MSREWKKLKTSQINAQNHQNFDPLFGFCNQFWPKAFCLRQMIFSFNVFWYLIFWYINAKICNKPFPNCTNNCYSICIIWRQIDFKVDTAIYIFSLLLTSKEWPTSSKPKKIQKPQFLSTLFSNFWYFRLSTYVSNGKWPNFGWSPLWKTFLILDHCAIKLGILLTHSRSR